MLKIYNSLGRELQEFKALDTEKVRMYTCGPTVYHYVTIGNWRTYTLSDFVLRTLKYHGYSVDFVMNITDVGHLTGDNFGDANTGEDRLEKQAIKESKTAWDIAKFYTDDFLNGFKALNLVEPLIFSKATDHIVEQIELIQKIEKAGYTYLISDGVYFDINKYENDGYKYGELSNLDEIKEGARIEPNPEKKNPKDFALWKFSPREEKRQMEWQSPWGVGFPGWHIECSAMAMKYLGEQFDLHLGGEDLLSTHHPSEIAQSESATGISPFVNYWMHGAFLTVNGGKMGKSLGNAYRIEDIVSRNFSPMDLRYFYMSGHYRKKINFTWEALEASKISRERLISQLTLVKGDGEIIQSFKESFIMALEEDFNLTKALAIVWEILKSDYKNEDKYTTIIDFDKVFGLNLELDIIKKSNDSSITEYSDEVKELIEKRNEARVAKNFQLADEIRSILQDKHGINVIDASK